jgi:hypothetical protein
MYLYEGIIWFIMKDSGNKKGKSGKVESPDAKTAAVTGEKVPAKAAPLSAKEKIAANQKSKRRK